MAASPCRKTKSLGMTKFLEMLWLTLYLTKYSLN
jgi:hypothetical protein